MERLTAFEFIAAQSGPQLVRLKRKDEVLCTFGAVRWLGYVPMPNEEFVFDAKEDLVIEGVGIGHPYWNGEQPPWTLAFDSIAEASRIGHIYEMALREIKRGILHLGAAQ